MPGWKYDKVLDVSKEQMKRCVKSADTARKLVFEEEVDTVSLTQKDKVEILEAVARLERKLNTIFGDSVLINGQFVTIKVKQE